MCNGDKITINAMLVFGSDYFRNSNPYYIYNPKDNPRCVRYVPRNLIEYKTEVHVIGDCMRSNEISYPNLSNNV